MELTREKLQEMAAVDIRGVDINSLTDLRDIVVDTPGKMRYRKIPSCCIKTTLLVISYPM